MLSRVWGARRPAAGPPGPGAPLGGQEVCSQPPKARWYSGRAINTQKWYSCHLTLTGGSLVPVHSTSTAKRRQLEEGVGGTFSLVNQERVTFNAARLK